MQLAAEAVVLLSLTNQSRSLPGVRGWFGFPNEDACWSTTLTKRSCVTAMREMEQANRLWYQLAIILALSGIYELLASVTKKLLSPTICNMDLTVTLTLVLVVWILLSFKNSENQLPHRRRHVQVLHGLVGVVLVWSPRAGPSCSALCFVTFTLVCMSVHASTNSHRRAYRSDARAQADQTAPVSNRISHHVGQRTPRPATRTPAAPSDRHSGLGDYTGFTYGNPWEGLSWNLGDRPEEATWWIDGAFARSERQMAQVAWWGSREIHIPSLHTGRDNTTIEVEGTIKDILEDIFDVCEGDLNSSDERSAWFFDGIDLDGTVRFVA